MWYKLGDDHIPVETTMEEANADGFGTTKGVVRQDVHLRGALSTVFLYLDHRFGDGPPMLFETMWFPYDDNDGSEVLDRYPTWDEALAGHMRHAEELGIAAEMQQRDLKAEDAKAAEKRRRRHVNLDD
ncbi:hypothetical protein CC53_gp159 [Rhizobium phage vB_RleS_L338C]|uniref:hypothetical protein n=1 Tax=Rhizobium phage vB_RleS_L338C TaxID=1414737 RepID=UPI0003D95C6B|nr:hypothetical protein CC53_gp159 [Rhizobium phage vB_RleS_L338C]AHC30576.1 hypothetical protein L338C_159 [Rhizobium phage vB_RleS_L338C]QNH72123.1 hypothetical protein P11VFA_160 [Rhizobium phage P11VFA]